MEVQYFKRYSYNLNRDMEFKVYGHAGRPVLYIPCQDGRFFVFENFKMTDTWAPWIESGQVMVFSIDTMDKETWSNKGANPRWRAERHEQWMRYITDEMVPFMRDMVNLRNGWTGYPGIMVFGCSLGATHATNIFYSFFLYHYKYSYQTSAMSHCFFYALIYTTLCKVLIKATEINIQYLQIPLSSIFFFFYSKRA